MIRRRLPALAALAGWLILGPVPGRAAVGDDTVFFRLGVFAGYRTPGSLGDGPEVGGLPAAGGPFDLDASPAWGLLAGFGLADRLDLELVLDRARTAVSPGGPEVWSSLYAAGLRYRFLSPGRDWYPFLGLGIGGHRLSPREGLAASADVAGLVDAGAEFPVGDRFAVRVDLRLWITRVGGGDASWMPLGSAGGGFVFAF